MTEKQRIVESLGEQALLVPAQLNAALAANDCVKYRFTLLQTARARAERPALPQPDLRRERIACGIDDETLDRAVSGSLLRGAGRYYVPGAAGIVAGMLGDLDAMLRPLQGADAQRLRERLDALRPAAAAPAEDTLSAAAIDTLTAGTRGASDSLHLLVMDTHKALNALQASIANEDIDGADAYAVSPEDRGLVAAFMRGLHRTAPLKFDHPGLGTTATRYGGKLVLQNDIGTTDAHVIVIHVEERSVAITYTDVHLQRAMFFQGLFARRGVSWEDTRSHRDETLESEVFHLCTGRFAAADRAGVEEFLDFVGSRLVFLIDWNRARKRLRRLVPKDDTLRLLKWAADNDCGHMAFLRAGGEQLVYDALDYVVKGPARFGEELHQIIGLPAACEYLKWVLRACSEAMLRGEPSAFVQDSVRAELFRHFRSGQERLYDLAGEHAAYIVEIAAGVRDTVFQARAGDALERLRANAARAREWEHRADELVNQIRAAARHGEGAEAFQAIVESADDAADELEDAAFHLTLLAEPGGRSEPFDRLRELADLLVEGAQEYMKTVEIARDLRRGSAREDMTDFLGAVHRISQMEHRTDDVNRAAKAAIIAAAEDFRVLHVLTETARHLEQAADALMHCGMQARDHVLGKVMST